MQNIKKTIIETKTFKQSERGFSMMEMVIAMVLFLIVTGAIWGLLQTGRIDRNRASRRSDVMKNARAAMHLIGRDALNAGLGYNRSGAMSPENFLASRIGIPSDIDSNRDVITGIIAGDNLFQNDLQDVQSARTDMVTFAYRDMDFNAGNLITLVDAGADPLSASTIKLLTAPGAAANARIFDLYLVESQHSQILVMATGVAAATNSIFIAPGDPIGFNQPLNGSGQGVSLLVKCTATITQNCTDYAALVKKVFLVSYKVKQDGTLVRIVYGNNTGAAAAQQIQELPLAYNVKDMQIKYVLKDGTVSDNPTAGPDKIPGNADDKQEYCNLIRQITVTLKVASGENDEQTKKPEVITLTSTFSTRNLEYDAG